MNTARDCWVSTVQGLLRAIAGFGSSPRRSFSSIYPVHVVEPVAVSMVVDVPAADNAASTSPRTFDLARRP
jgi:hypothetical protein